MMLSVKNMFIFSSQEKIDMWNESVKKVSISCQFVRVGSQSQLLKSDKARQYLAARGGTARSEVV